MDTLLREELTTRIQTDLPQRLSGDFLLGIFHKGQHSSLLGCLYDVNATTPFGMTYDDVLSLKALENPCLIISERNVRYGSQTGKALILVEEIDRRVIETDVPSMRPVNILTLFQAEEDGLFLPILQGEEIQLEGFSVGNATIYQPDFFQATSMNGISTEGNANSQ